MITTTNQLEQQHNRINNFLLPGLQNLRQGLNDLSLNEFIVATLEMLMLLERDEYLQKIKHDNLHDKGNGSYPRAFKSLSSNSLIINVPRTRYTDFKPFVLEFLKYSQEQVNELVLKLYTKGLTTRDISDVLATFFGQEISYSQVSNLAERFHELRLAWEKTSLEAYYKVVYCDALYVTLRRGNSYSKEPVHIIYGLREDNKPEVLDISVNPSESANSWSGFLDKLKQRGVKKVDLFVADGLKGLEHEIHRAFPGAAFQKCVVHKMRNILNKVRPKEKSAVAQELKEVFDNFDKDSTLEQAQAKLQKFIDKWGKVYPFIKNSLQDDTLEYYFTYIQFPGSIRRMIYTTNNIESLNKKLPKATKNKQSFEKEDRLLDYIFVLIKEFEQNNWMKYPLSKFNDWLQQTQPI
jgi:putative transposase